MLILKQNTPNSVPTPPAGKGTIFLSDQDVLSVKTSDGNVEAFPTVGGSNTQIFYNNQNAIDGSANLTWNSATDTLGVVGTANVSGNIAVGGIKTDNYYYANGQPLDFEQPAGSNTEIIYNNGGNFGASANFTFDSAINTLTVNGNIIGGNVSGGNLVSANYVSGTLTTNAQPNITSLGTLTSLETSGNAIIGGNLTVNGNITYVNVETFDVEDPIISVGGGPNGDPLTSNDGKDRGTALQYFTSAPVTAFMGWDNGNGEFAFGSNVTITNDVVAYTTLGNVRASTLLGNIDGATANFTGNIAASNANLGNVDGASANFTGNISAANANLGNLVTGNYFTGVLTYAAQPNITSVGILTELQIGATADKANDFPNAKTVSSQDNTGDGLSAPIGLAGEAVADSANNVQAFGLYGVARANGTAKGTGVQGTALVTNTADTGAAVGVRGYATATHSGGYNIGVLGNALGSGVGNYAFYVQNGGIASIENATFWDLTDNSNAALTFNSTGKANIFGIETTDNSEGIFTSGYLNVVGNISAAGIKTNNYYYANGSPVDFQQAGGSNTQVQFNDADGFGGSAAFTFDKTSNLVSMAGALSVTGNANVGNLGTGGLIVATGNVTGGNLVTSGVVSATGNVSGGNITTGGAVDATGNVSGGNITTGGVVSATGNVSGGNLTTGGTLSVTGNANVGNLGAAAGVFTANVTAGNVYANSGTVGATLLTGTLTTNAQPNVTSVGTLTSLAVTGNASAGNISTGGELSGVTLSVTGNANVGNLGTAGLIAAGGNVSGANLTTGGELSVTGNANVGNLGATNGVFTTNVTAGNVYANSGTIGASLLTGTLTTNAQPNITSVGTLTSLTVTGNVSAGNVSATDITGTTLGGTLTTAAQPNVTSVGTLTSLSVTGNVAAGNLTTTGILSVTGTGVSSIAGNLDMTSNNIINLATPVNDSDAATKAYVDNLASTGIHYHIPVRVESPTALNATYNQPGGAGVGVGATLTNAGANAALVIDGVSLNVADRVLVYQQTNQTQNGVYVVTTVGDGSTAWVLTRASDADTYAPSTSAGLDEGSYFYVQEGATGAGESYVCNTPGVITFGTTNITFAQFSASQVYSAGTGLTLTNTTFSVNASQTQITSVGTLTGLNVNGNITAANITANTGVFTGNGSGLSAIAGANVTGQVGNALVAGTVYTAAQPNITSVGTLTSLAVTGNVTAGNVSATDVTGTTLGGTLTTAAQPNITSVGTLSSLAVTGNATAGNVYANSGTIGASLLTGTLTTAAQPNITSVGSLTSLTVTGNVSGGNLNTAGAVVASTLTSNVITGTAPLTVTSTTRVANLNVAYANVADNINVAAGSGNNFIVFASAATGNVAEVTSTGLIANLSNNSITATTFVGALSGAATTAGTVTTAAQPNITSVGTLSSLSVTGSLTTTQITTGGNTTAGNITGNWTLTAGSRFNATYADLAERYTADDDYEPGTVLMFGGDEEVTMLGVADSTRVAGVVTTNPAYLMNAECESEFVVDIALIGRVPIKVQGPVVKGDLLVSSEMPGYAKANNEARAGTIIGKALENYNGPTPDGIIEAMVGRC